MAPEPGTAVVPPVKTVLGPRTRSQRKDLRTRCCAFAVIQHASLGQLPVLSVTLVSRHDHSVDPERMPPHLLAMEVNSVEKLRSVSVGVGTSILT